MPGWELCLVIIWRIAPEPRWASLTISFPWQESIRNRNQADAPEMARDLPAHLENILNMPPPQGDKCPHYSSQLSSVSPAVGGATARWQTYPTIRLIFKTTFHAVSCERGTSFMNTQNINIPKNAPATHFWNYSQLVIISSDLSSLCPFNANMQMIFHMKRKHSQ